MEYKEIFRLKEMLEEANIPFKWKITNFKPSDGYQIIIYSKDGITKLCDCIEHFGSYGNEEDKLEIMSGLTEEESENDSVLGWLTAEEVFKRFKYCYENKLFRGKIFECLTGAGKLSLQVTIDLDIEYEVENVE